MVCLGGGSLGCRVRINIAITPAAKAENVGGYGIAMRNPSCYKVKKKKRKVNADNDEVVMLQDP